LIFGGDQVGQRLLELGVGNGAVLARVQSRDELVMRSARGHGPGAATVPSDPTEGALDEQGHEQFQHL
jgi:hypothetical protein